MRLHDRVVIVTGASRGLGAAIAMRCAAEGARLVLASRDAGLLETRAEAIRAAGGRAVAVPTDVGRLDDLRRLCDESTCMTGANVVADLGMTSLLVGREPYASRPIAGS